MFKKILILSLFVSFFPLFSSAEADSRGNSFGNNFQERVSDAVSAFSEQSQERIQERVAEKKGEVEEKREALQNIISQIPDSVLQDRLNNFQDGIGNMNTRFSERYYNYLNNASNSIENIADRIPEEALSEETQEKWEAFSNHIEEMYELVEGQLLEDYIIEADSVQNIANQFQNKIQELRNNHSEIQEQVMGETRELRVQFMRNLVADFSEYMGGEDDEEEVEEEDVEEAVEEEEVEEGEND